MNNNNYQITIDRTTDGKASEVMLIPGGQTESVRMQARPGATYTLTDKASDKAPQQIFARRRGKDLHLQFDVQRPMEAPDLILENFYEGKPGQIVGVAEDANTYRFIPNTAQEFDQLSVLADGASASQVLGGAVFAASVGAPLEVASAPLIGVAGFALGPAGMAAAGLAGAAVLAGGGGGGGSSLGTNTPATVFKAGLMNGEDTGASSTDNITKKTQPKIGGTAIPGSTVLIKVDNGSEQEVPVDALGNWSWTPPVLSNGEHTITTTVIDPSKNTTIKSFNLTVDTINIKAQLTSNFSSLNTEPVGNVDAKLNINESKSGVLMTVLLDETPGRELTFNDLNLVGGTLQASSFRKDPSNSKKYTVLANPTADSTGDLVLSWSKTVQGLTDVAGNPLDSAATQSLTVPYDTLAPQAVVFSGSKSVQVSSSQNLSIGWTSANAADISRIDVTLLGQTVTKTSNLSSLALASAGEGLDKLVEGYYTLTTTFYDAAGNSSSQQAVLAVNRNSLGVCAADG